MARSRPISIEAYVQRKKKKHLINREKNWVARQWTTVPLLRGEKSRIFGVDEAITMPIVTRFISNGAWKGVWLIWKEELSCPPDDWFFFFFAFVSIARYRTVIQLNVEFEIVSIPLFFSFYLFVRNERKIRNELGQPKYSREPSVMLIAGGIAIFSRQRARPVSFH